MPTAWEVRVGRWVEAGLLEPAAADRIRAWEAAHAPSGVRWRCAWGGKLTPLELR